MIVVFSNKLAAKCECRERPALHLPQKQIGEFTVYKCSACGRISTWKAGSSERKMVKICDGAPHD